MNKNLCSFRLHFAYETKTRIAGSRKTEKPKDGASIRLSVFMAYFRRDATEASQSGYENVQYKAMTGLLAINSHNTERMINDRIYRLTEDNISHFIHYGSIRRRCPLLMEWDQSHGEGYVYKPSLIRTFGIIDKWIGFDRRLVNGW